MPTCSDHMLRKPAANLESAAAKANDVPCHLSSPHNEEEVLRRMKKYMRKCDGKGEHLECAFSRTLGCVIDDETLVPLPHRFLDIRGEIPVLEDSRISQTKRGSYGTEPRGTVHTLLIC